jgi:hypothetical protein
MYIWYQRVVHLFRSGNLNDVVIHQIRNETVGDMELPTLCILPTTFKPSV